MFDGHQLVKFLNGEWVFDVTEYIGYRVILDAAGSPVEYTKAFEMYASENGLELLFEKYVNVPMMVLRAVEGYMNHYKREALLV